MTPWLTTLKPTSAPCPTSFRSVCPTSCGRKLCARKNKQRARERAPVVEKSVEEHLKELESLPSPYPTPWRRSRPYTARLRALCVATANPRGDSFLVQIRGRELELTDGWVIELHARKKLGEKASLAAVARLHPDKSMTKRRVQSLRENMPSWKPSERPGMDFDWCVTEGGTAGWCVTGWYDFDRPDSDLSVTEGGTV